jgi:long-chain acyl-CoA synthetase
MPDLPPDRDLRCIADHWTQHDPDRTALVLGDDTRSWQQLTQGADAVANALTRDSVTAGDRVALLDKNDLEYFEVLLGAARVGAVLVAVNWRLAPPEIAYVLSDAGATHCFVGPDFTASIDAIRADVPALRHVIGLGEAAPVDRSYTEWLASPTPHRAVTAHTDATILQLYTSGTTGHPKGVMSSVANLAASLNSAIATFEFDRDARVLVAMPLFHIGGAGWSVAGLASGATAIIVRDLTPQVLLGTLVNERITHAFVVPAVIEMLLAVPGIDTANLAALRCLAYGAAPISADLLTRARRTLDVDFFQIYGMTEATGSATVLGPVDQANPERIGSAGQAATGIELRIVDPDTTETVPPGQVGEVWVHGAQVMQGYWNQPDATSETIVDGWLRTGDAGRLDPDGYVYISDRVKDMIISGGENIYPAEIENVLAGHPDVATAAVIGVPSERWGETVLAVVVPRSETADEQAIIDYCRARLAHFKCPTRVEFVEHLPMNPSGKVLKRELREPYWAGIDRRVH